MRLAPADVVSTWPEANFANPETHGPALSIANGFFMALMLIVVFLRYYSRYSTRSRLGLDDIFIGLSATFSVALGAVVVNANAHYGWSRHIWDVPTREYKGAFLSFYLGKVLFILASTITRTSLLCFYFRLVGETIHQKFKWTLWITLVGQIIVGIVFLFVQAFLCNPVEAYWEVALSDTATCYNEGYVNLTSAIVNTVLELWITLLPIPIVMGLNMPLRQRLQVVGLLSLGIVVTITGVLRVYYIWRAFRHTYDVTWYTHQLWICAVVEVDLAVFCASAPALKTLIRPLLRGLLHLTNTPQPTPANNNTRATGTLPTYSSQIYAGHAVSKSHRSDSHASSRVALVEEEGGVSGKNMTSWLSWNADTDSEKERDKKESTAEAIELTSNASTNPRHGREGGKGDEYADLERQQTRYMVHQQTPPLPQLYRSPSHDVQASRDDRDGRAQERRRPLSGEGIEVETRFDIQYSRR